MNFQQLESFVSVVEERSFTATAARLHISQSTVSSHVIALEQELDVPLIIRTTRRLEVTRKGEQFYGYATRLLSLRDNATKDLSGNGCHEISLGGSSVPSRCYIPALLTRYLSRDPSVRFRMIESDSLKIIEKVADGSIDVGFTGTKTGSACSFAPFQTDELVVATPNTKMYRRFLKMEDPLPALLQEPFIVRSMKSGTQTEALKLLAQHGKNIDDLNVVAWIENAETLRQCIVDGLGISILSKSIIERLAHPDEVLTFKIGGEGHIRNLYVVYLNSCQHSNAVQNFIDFACSAQGRAE